MDEKLIKRKIYPNLSYIICKSSYDRHGVDMPLDFLISYADQSIRFAIMAPTRYDPEGGIACLEKGISMGSLECKFDLMTAYISLDEDYTNVAKGLRMLEELVDIDNYEDAYIIYAALLIEGKIVTKNINKAYDYIKIAADNGNKMALHYINGFYKGLFGGWKYKD